MISNPQTKRLLKTLRYQARRAQAGFRWGAENLNKMPAVFGNAMPKSGSHLLIQILEGLVDIGPFVNPGFPPVNRFEDNSKLPDEAVLTEISKMKPGDIRYGYLHAEEPWLSALTGPDRATIFVHRDPRDWVISQIFYATEMHAGHMMRTYYQELGSMEARINAAISGVQDSDFKAPSLAERYAHYLGWRDIKGVLSMRFEDLILERRDAIEKILKFLAEFGFTLSDSPIGAMDILEDNIAPRKSGTFRKGQPGEWREHFTDANVEVFKEKTGNLLVELGYETSSDW